MRKRPVKRSRDVLFQQNKNLILSGILNCSTPVQVESSIAFANYLNHVGITRQNYRLFLAALETNNQWVVDALIGKREPSLLFASIRPNRYMVRKAFKLLSFWHPKQIYSKVLLALIGIIQSCYHNPDDGNRIAPLRINDLNNMGKYLDEEQDQDQPENRLILDIFDRITALGEFQNDFDKNVLAKHAFNIRIAYFDHTKRLLDCIPQVLLTRIKHSTYQVKPSKQFQAFFKSYYKSGKKKIAE
jgi:hypothetical protein